MVNISCLNCGVVFEDYRSNNRKFCCIPCRDSFKSKNYKPHKHWNWKGGKPGCAKCEKKCSDWINKRCRGCWAGENHPNWKGGITPEARRARTSKEYLLWRAAVFERDDYTCVFCNKKGVRLEADHIKPFSLFPELRFAIDNGRTLCRTCHRKTDTWGRRCKL